METTDRQNQDDKQKALDMTVQYVEKRFGKGSLMRLGETGSRMQVETISTGALTLDLALGIGGIPRGRMWRFTDQKGPVKQRWLCILSPMRYFISQIIDTVHKYF